MEKVSRAHLPSNFWLLVVWLGTAWVSLLWVLHRESQLPAKPAPVAGHAFWVLSALSYIWLSDDHMLTFIPHFGLESDIFKPLPEIKKIVRFQLMWISIYVLLSTTVLAWLLRVVPRRSLDVSRVQSRKRLNGLLLGSICAMLAFIANLVILNIGPFYDPWRAHLLLYFSKFSEDTLFFYFVLYTLALLALPPLALLLAAIEVARGNKMAFRVVVGELLGFMLSIGFLLFLLTAAQ